MNTFPRSAFVWLVLIMIARVCCAEETQPGVIFKKVLAAYEAMDTYSAEGKIVSDIDNGGVKINTETSFSIKLKKPNLYLIVWDQRVPMTFNPPQSGAVWNDGTQPYLYMGGMKAYSKMSSDEIALGGATGISGGAAFTIPSLFLSVFKEQRDPFARLIEPKLTGSEQIDGEDCYVMTGSSTVSKKETFWISKKTCGIKKYSRSLEQPEGGSKMPKMTDQQLEDSIKAMGQEVTPERKEAMRKMMEQALATLKTAKLKGASTELHTKIDAPKLKESDFQFTLPAGTVLKDSLWGGILNKK